MKAALYVRVSTEKQTHDSQLAELREFCARRHWQTVEFSDKISGSKFTRSGLDAMMQLVRAGKVDAVVVYKLDRLGRSLPHLAILIQEFQSNHVALVVTSQGIDTSQDSAVGRLQLGVLMAVAEFERSIIRERVMAGLAAARTRGVKLGRRDKLSQFRAKVLELRARGMGLRAIARELKLPVSSIHKLTK